ncbi:uncharacterized protein DFL_009283 [Arthrobotrys flagrans]|uniref:Uncharacterized protein n=1 Tax=Arthrobotrys flagrans TaxID=97331 RepID=A0A436ZR78_ARTFL|nr:hypothetical protein DFL_009283 [Arthrobotrys flagrans]
MSDNKFQKQRSGACAHTYNSHEDPTNLRGHVISHTHTPSSDIKTSRASNTLEDLDESIENSSGDVENPDESMDNAGKMLVDCLGELNLTINRTIKAVIARNANTALEPTGWSPIRKLMTQAQIEEKERELHRSPLGPPILGVLPTITVYKCGDCGIIRTKASTWHTKIGANGAEAAQKFAHLTEIQSQVDAYFDILDPIVGATGELLHDSLSLLNKVDVVTLKELKSPGESTGVRPFCAKQVTKTRNDYFRVITRLICFATRLMLEDLARCSGSPSLHGEIPTRVISLIVALVPQQPFGLGCFSNIGVNFLYLTGYDSGSKVFQHPENYTSLLAGFVFSFRLPLIAACYRYRDRIAVTEPDKADTAFHRYFEYVNRNYLKDSSRTVFGEALSLLAYGKVLFQDAMAANKLYWDEASGYTKLAYKWHAFDILEFRGFVQQMLQSPGDEVSKLPLCEKSESPELPEIVYDMPSETSLG